ncbi:MAG: YidB family protein [Methyloceanibacter sp.]
MGLLDNVFGSGSSSAVPGGNVTKPLMIALLALLASRYMSGGSKEAPASARPDTAPTLPDSMPDPSPGTILGGLGGLLKQFQQKGLGEVADSWIKTGPNKAVAPGQISDALGPDVIDTLSQRTGLSKDQVLQILSQVLPNAVDQFTPQGRLPSQQELARLIG